MDISVLTPKQLAERWQISLAKVYEDNNAGKIPHLTENKNRFPIAAIEEIEMEATFDKNNVKTPRERRLERELEQQSRILSQKDMEIQKLSNLLLEIQIMATKEIYSRGQAPA